MEQLFQKLKNKLKGEVRFDPLSRKIYSVDASIFEVEPLGIIIPTDKEDLLTAMRIAAEHNIPITPRGAATGITGSCLGRGLIIDTSQYLNHILEINIEEEYAICEPGVVQDRLNEALSPFGYRLGPDTSTGNRATIAGMLANNSAGARSLRYGRMVDHIDTVELALTGGTLITFSPVDEIQWQTKSLQNTQEGKIYREISRIQEQYHNEIADNFPKIPRRVSGYNLDILLKGFPCNISQLIAGSEGTLGIATQIKVKIAKKPKHTGICIIHLKNMIEGLHSIQDMLAHKPLALEMIDDKILTIARLSPTVRHKMQWLIDSPQAVFIAEFDGDSTADVERKLADFFADMKKRNVGYAQVLLTDPAQIAHVWEVRKAGLGLLLSKRSYSRAIAFIEDLSIDPLKLAPFMEQFCGYLKSIGKEAGIYGHIGSGCMHIRPYIDLRQTDELALLHKIMNDISTMVLEYGGAMSGEHGDGLIRSWLNEKMFGKKVYQAFKELKSAFDPLNLMNPGKIVDAPSMPEDLRLHPKSEHVTIPTFLNFKEEGGFELAADLCNGNGQCRKAESVMCPSFQATNDEFHTTRARAQSLRSIIHGKLPLEDFTGKALYEVLDLCLECKGCKRECPSQVDMAKMKAEFLYQYQEKHGYSLRSRIFGNIHAFNRFNSPFARIFNALSSTFISKTLLSCLGVSSKRELPKLALEPFSKWFNKQIQSQNKRQVILFNDTYTEFNHPEIGQASFKVLSALGYHITLANGLCCGRPLISKGLLKQAKANAARVIETLFQSSKEGISIIILEPSCSSALRDDFKGLVSAEDSELKSMLDSVMQHCTTFDEFMQSHLVKGRLPLSLKDNLNPILVHGHCHQKALVGSQATLDVLRGISETTVNEIQSGCCGMAGSFGYEKEHYDISMKIGELHLLPAIRSAPESTQIVASGVSCRTQIAHGTKRRALHLAEVIASHMK